ncbi:hypothetical protein A4A49_56981, partial [Nicotiana attenuata]
MIDKGPPKPTRDVPAKTALARLFNAVNPVVQAYDELALNKATTGLATDVVPKFVGDRTEGVIQIGKTNDGVAAGDRTKVRQPHKGVVVLDNGVPTTTNLMAAVDCTERVQGFEQGTLAQGTGNRGSAGTLKDPGAEQIMKEGQLQQMVKDSAIAGADRLTTAKYHAAVTVVEHVNKAGIQSSVAGSKLETNVALNTTGDRPTAGVTQASATAKKPIDLISTGEQDEGKELEGAAGLVSAAGTKVKATFEQSKQQKPAADQAKDRAWTVVNRSPSKRNSPAVKNQIIVQRQTDVSNSFDALINEHVHVMKEAGKSMHQVDHNAISKSGEISVLGSGKQQETSKNLGARETVSQEIDTAKYRNATTIQTSTAAVPTIHISNPVLDDFEKGEQQVDSEAISNT